MSLSNTQYTSSNYNTLSDVLDSYRSFGNGYYNSQNRRKANTTLSLSQSLGEWGYLSVNGSRDDYWDQPGHNESFGANYGVGLWGGSLSLNWTQNKRADRSGVQQNDRITSVMFSVPMDRWLGGGTNASYQYVSPSNGDDTQQIGLNGRAFERQLYWSVSQRYRAGAESGDSNNSALNLTWYGGYGRLRGDYSYTQNIRQMGADLSGGMVVHRKGVTLGQPLSNTVALISAPGAAGVPVGGWPGVKTDFRGYTTQANLNPYQENMVSLDPRRLSTYAEIPQTDTRVIPTQGAVVQASFATRIGARALMTLIAKDGNSIPFGALVTLDGQTAAAGVVDANGVVFLSGLPTKGALTVKWGQNQQQCRVSYQLPTKPGPANMYVMNNSCV